jgi:hypothetical protein
LVEAVNKLAAKIDSYDKRFSSLGSDISKNQSQVNLSMRSIQALQKEQVLLLHAVNPTGTSGGSLNSNGVMGQSSAGGAINMQSDSLPHQHQGDFINHSSPVHSVNHGSSQFGGSDSEPRRHWMPKMDFSRLDESDVRIWLDKCATYFQLYAIPPDFSVTAASLHMVDKASHWYQNYKHSAGNHTWEHFVVAVSQALEVNTHRVKTMELLNLHQTGSVEEYKLHFDQLLYRILVYDKSISETLSVSHFLMGLIQWKCTYLIPLLRMLPWLQFRNT